MGEECEERDYAFEMLMRFIKAYLEEALEAETKEEMDAILNKLIKVLNVR